MTYAVLTTMKNEGPFLLEWLAHHMVLGFDKFVVCFNDCEDGTDRMLRRLNQMGLVQQHRTTVRAGGIQRSALRQGKNYPEIAEADWVYVCDADEFLNIHVGDNSVKALVENSGPDPDVVAVPWKIFGTGGLRRFVDAPVTAQFTLCERDWHETENPKAGHQVKSLVRDHGRFLRLGVHVPVARPEDDDRFAIVRPGGAGTDTPPSFHVAQVNHYIVRSMDSYLVKRDRGRVNHANQTMGLEYWEYWNRNDASDTSIARYTRQTNHLFEELLKDPQLGRLHRRACRWHRLKSAEMREREELAPIVARMEETLYGLNGLQPNAADFARAA